MDEAIHAIMTNFYSIVIFSYIFCKASIAIPATESILPRDLTRELKESSHFQ